uniref:Uncharacterized protein n=1 Tax=Anguilla anguilla TaxID=7936 RepID=A0A0E9WW44_ANGAN
MLSLNFPKCVHLAGYFVVIKRRLFVSRLSASERHFTCMNSQMLI